MWAPGADRLTVVGARGSSLCRAVEGHAGGPVPRPGGSARCLVRVGGPWRGHFSTKSRRYSTTLTALRLARVEHRAQERRTALGLTDRPVITVGRWQYAGRGYSPDAALVAASVRDGGGHHGA
jgi:hypothetical protein